MVDEERKNDDECETTLLIDRLPACLSASLTHSLVRLSARSKYYTRNRQQRSGDEKVSEIRLLSFVMPRYESGGVRMLRTEI